MRSENMRGIEDAMGGSIKVLIQKQYDDKLFKVL